MIYDNLIAEKEGSPLKRMLIFIGSYGSGKSELSIRFALNAAKEGKTLLIDLDMVNTYFRATDRKKELSEAGVELISPNYVSSNVETLSLPAKVMSAFDSDWHTVIFDVGGEAAGAMALGRFYGAFLSQEAPPEMYLVVNTRRPMAESPERVKQMIAELEAAARQAEKDSEENKRLRELLNLREQRRDLSDFEAAFVTEHTVTNWTSSLTLNKGTAHGVEVNDSVIDETGALVGVVSEVGYNWCSVLTIVDTDTSLGAQVFRTKDLGLATGDFALMGENRLRLDYLPAGCQLISGDLVVTSGLGGYYPEELVIGSVLEVKRDDTGSDSYAVVVPAVDFDALTEVFIIKSFDIVT